MAMQIFVDSAKVMAKGQVTIPKDVREVLGVSNGDKVTFIVEGETVRVVNAAVYAMQMLQLRMFFLTGYSRMPLTKKKTGLCCRVF